jgi:hypothetical protein
MTNTDTTATTEKTRAEQAKQLMGQAGQTLKSEAQSFASVAQDRVRAEARKGAKTATKTLGDFADAVRLAGDRLAESDQSPVSRLVRQAADSLEDLSRNLAGKDPEDLLRAVRDFGRRNPAAFVGGAVLLGFALGRVLRATDAPPQGLADDDLAFEVDAYDEPAAYAAADLDAPPADDLNAAAPGSVTEDTPQGDAAAAKPPFGGGV